MTRHQVRFEAKKLERCSQLDQSMKQVYLQGAGGEYRQLPLGFVATNDFVSAFCVDLALLVVAGSGVAGRAPARKQ